MTTIDSISFGNALLLTKIDLIIPREKRYRFWGTPHLTLKYSKFGAGKIKEYGWYWKPLSIELCLTDDDDCDIDYKYYAADEAQFNEIIAAVLNWMQKIENIEISTYDIFDVAPMQDKLERCF